MSDHARLREFHDEEERIKLRMLQADAGLIGRRDILVTSERMDWMYHNPTHAKKEKEAEEFLLGKSVTTTDEREEMKKRLGVGTTAPGSLFMSSVTQQNEDTLRRVREDPLFIIRQAEHQQHRMDVARERILGNSQPKKKLEKKKRKEDQHREKRIRHMTDDEKSRDKRENDDGRRRDDERRRDGERRRDDERRNDYGERRMSRDGYNNRRQEERRVIPRHYDSNSYNDERKERRDNDEKSGSAHEPYERRHSYDHSISTDRSIRNEKNERNNERDHRDSEAVTTVPKGPVLPREWKEKLKNIEPVDESESDSSSDADIGPPLEMAGLVERRRKERNEAPLLQKTRRGGQTVSITDSIIKPSSSSFKEEPVEDEDVFAKCREQLENEEDERERRLKGMMVDGKR